MESQNLAEGIIFLVLHYKLIPTLLLRKYLFLVQDNSSLINNYKLNETNKRLLPICVRFNWCFIDNSSVERSCFNRRCLHLNRKGSSLLSRIFLCHL